MGELTALPKTQADFNERTGKWIGRGGIKGREGRKRQGYRGGGTYKRPDPSAYPSLYISVLYSMYRYCIIASNVVALRQYDDVYSP